MGMLPHGYAMTSYLHPDQHRSTGCNPMYLDGQGRTDPMGIRAMPWGPPPKGAHQTSQNNANQQISITKQAQPSLANIGNIVMKHSLWGPLVRIRKDFLNIRSHNVLK